MEAEKGAGHGDAESSLKSHISDSIQDPRSKIQKILLCVL